jgi:mono/diheme cytochrome c family protein
MRLSSFPASGFVLAAVALAACNSPPTTGNASNDIFATATSATADAELLARGEYLVRIAGCNDCHTPGYAARQGDVDKAQWLVGSPLGYKGPWGTTYAVNLRSRLAGMDEAQWLDYSAKLRTRPIMPDFSLRAMSAEDRRALYRFVRSLGPGGGEVPAYLPPGSKAPLPYMELMLPPPAPTVASTTP